MNKISPLAYRKEIFILFVLIVFITTGAEIIFEFAEGESVMDMSDDLARFFLSFVVLGVFLIEYRTQKVALDDLKNQLQNMRGKMNEMDNRSSEIACQYRGVMQKQFDAWQLSKSEQDVVIHILKGLSFREIAALRQTQEKTVRQQASSVYRKAGVSNRNELTAWFFEDMLDPITEQTAPR